MASDAVQTVDRWVSRDPFIYPACSVPIEMSLCSVFDVSEEVCVDVFVVC